MPEAGWFPDPSGQRDQLRWWDGRAWTGQVRPAGPDTSPPPRARGVRRLLLVLLAAVALVVAVVAVVVTQVVRPPSGGTAPGGQSTRQVCPMPTAVASPAPQTEPGRVTSGRMSVPELGPEWSTQPDNRVPFGRQMMRQQILVDTDPSWIVSLNVGTMVAGDGFFTPEQGVHVVMPCLVAEYYSGHEVQRTDLVDEARTVDGHPAWVLESELTFEIPGLDFTSERLVLILVDLGDGTAGAVVVDLPAIARDREPALRAALDDIRVT
ncbi:DUF2510 domain-containing protein [Desertihabitans brevis]|uniref:DUF2510 domain-containing protein n=1 Tax=Desertihabitans brevis TaxID=2268447 RepID=UPI0018F627BA|nr:DUF2510 domain-containing protein [Desertihabitans brevis]